MENKGKGLVSFFFLEISSPSGGYLYSESSEGKEELSYLLSLRIFILFSRLEVLLFILFNEFNSLYDFYIYVLMNKDDVS